jgi:hypothetical protein
MVQEYIFILVEKNEIKSMKSKGRFAQFRDNIVVDVSLNPFPDLS